MPDIRGMEGPAIGLTIPRGMFKTLEAVGEREGKDIRTLIVEYVERCLDERIGRSGRRNGK